MFSRHFSSSCMQMEKKMLSPFRVECLVCSAFFISFYTFSVVWASNGKKCWMTFGIYRTQNCCCYLCVHRTLTTSNILTFDCPINLNNILYFFGFFLWPQCFRFISVDLVLTKSEWRLFYSITHLALGAEWQERTWFCTLINNCADTLNMHTKCIKQMLENNCPWMECRLPHIFMMISFVFVDVVADP